MNKVQWNLTFKATEGKKIHLNVEVTVLPGRDKQLIIFY